MKKIVLIISLIITSFALAQEKKLDFEEAKTNVFLKGFKLPEDINHSISLSPNYIKDKNDRYSMYNPITKQNIVYSLQENRLVASQVNFRLDHLNQFEKRDSFNPNGATDFKTGLLLGSLNLISSIFK